MNWIYFMLGFLSNKDKLIEIGKLLGVESQTCNDIPNKGRNVADSKMEGRKLMQYNHIFKAFSGKLLTSSVHITQIFTNVMM